MNKSIEYTTVWEQIEKLKSQNLIITNDQTAFDMLSSFGYSNLIKSYREPYISQTKNGELSYHNIPIEQIESLYTLDKNIRNAIMASMQDLEEHIKESSANVIAKSFGVNQNEYLQYKNYRDKKRVKYRFSLKGILETISKNTLSDKDPIAHYRNKYDLIPPWILFKSIYFSTMVNFISLFKPKEQEALASQLYNNSPFNFDTTDSKKIMMDTLYIALEFRNLAAHGGRMYNYTPSSTLRFDEISSLHLRDFIPSHGLGQLLELLDLLTYSAPAYRLRESIATEVIRHCEDYPHDFTFLREALQINASLTKVVHVTPNSKIFHQDSSCSGMKHPYQLTLEEATEQGYMPCKRCYR